MSKFINTETKVIVSVSDEKDDRFTQGWEPVTDGPKPRAKK